MKQLFLLAAVLMALLACSDEPTCVDCINGGVCIDGTCDCPEGFTGDSCQTEKKPTAIVIDYVELVSYSDTAFLYSDIWDPEDSTFADPFFNMVDGYAFALLYESPVIMNVVPSEGCRWETDIRVDITQNAYQEYVAITFIDKDDNFDEFLSKPGAINEAIRVYYPGENFPTEKMFYKEDGLVYKLGLSYEFD